MIRKKYILIPLVVMIVIITVGALSYYLFLSKVSSGEMVFAPTEVGTPEGDKVTKDIGPAGGSIASPDGRLTLTVPQNALTDTVAFTIQPITNKAGGGLGSAYRLGPDGKTFTTPLEISVRYDEHDLEGTIPEALSLAYQDEKAAWHAQKLAKLDRDKKTLTVSTTHFSDWSFLSRLVLSPSEATLPVGVGLPIRVLYQCQIGYIEKIFRKCEALPPQKNHHPWELQGAGTIDQSGLYTAPAKRPSPNIVHVLYSYEFEQWDETRIEKMTGTLAAVITIVDRGYRATGSDGPTSYSGTVCSLDKSFTVFGHNGGLTYTDQFTPSSGLATLSGQYGGATWAGSGPYKVEGIDTDKPQIVWRVSTTVNGLAGGTGVAHIDLVPLDTDECNKP